MPSELDEMDKHLLMSKALKKGLPIEVGWGLPDFGERVLVWYMGEWNIAQRENFQSAGPEPWTWVFESDTINMIDAADAIHWSPLPARPA